MKPKESPGHIPPLNCLVFFIMQDHFKKKTNFPITLKYIDPTYMIRAVRSNASDNVYCTLLAHSALHGAMAGYSGFTVAPVNGRHAYIPFYVSTAGNSDDPGWLITYVWRSPAQLPLHHGMIEQPNRRLGAGAIHFSEGRRS